MLFPKNVARLAVCALSLLLVPSPARAQASAEETIAYQKWYAASSAKETAKASQAAQEYLTQFPKGQHADYLRKWVSAERNKALNAAIQAKKTDEMLELGREFLARGAASQ